MRILLKTEDRAIETLTQAKDDALILMSSSGHTKAFEILVKRYETAVFNFICRMTREATAAEEIAQETFIEAYRQLNRFDRTRAFKPWLLGIAANRTRSYWRSVARRSSRIKDNTDDDPIEALKDSAVNPTEELDSLLDSQRILQAMTRLDSRYRAALLLRFQEDLSYEEAAEAMKIPLNTLRTWLRRGKETLRHMILEEQSHDK